MRPESAIGWDGLYFVALGDGAPIRIGESSDLDRRDFLKLLSAAGAAGSFGSADDLLAAPRPSGSYRPGRIVNEYSAFLPGEREALAEPPKVTALDATGAMASHAGAERKTAHGEAIAGWVLLITIEINGVMTAVFEKHGTHR